MHTLIGFSEKYAIKFALAVHNKKIIIITVPLNYNFTFTRVSTRVTTHGSHGRCQNLPWEGSFPRNGPWLFHAKTRGISRHVAFPRDDTWHFHETSRGISTRPVTVEFRVEYSRDQ